MLTVMSVFALLVIMAGSNLFYVKNVIFDYSGDTKELFNLVQSETQTNIFMLDKQKITYIIQTNHPYINVDFIECFFPDKVVIYLSDRQNFFAVKGDDGYYMCDKNLNITEKLTSFSSAVNNPIELCGVQIANGTCGMPAGDSNEFAKKLSHSLLEWKSLVNLQNEISSINIDYTKKDTVMISMHNGVTILIENANVNTSNKFNYALSYYEKTNKKSGIIKIIDTNGKTLLVSEK